MSLRTLHRRVREVAAWRRPRLVAKCAADAEQVVADLRQAITDLPDGAVVLAEDETHINWGALKVALANSPTLTIAGRIRQAHPGSPRVTDRTSGRPLSARSRQGVTTR
jgi:hypothetical protein